MGEGKNGDRQTRCGLDLPPSSPPAVERGVSYFACLRKVRDKFSDFVV